MPQDKDLKCLVRERMRETGERYTTGRAALTKPEPPSPQLSYGRELVGQLADKQLAAAVFSQLESLQPDVRRQLCVEGLRHEDWHVRRGCARLLDDLEISGDSERVLRGALADPHPMVRAAALHALICEGCKPDGCSIDGRAIAESMIDDPSGEVRRGVVASFWRWEADGNTLVKLRTIASTDRSARVRAEARNMAEFQARQLAANAARFSLPEEMQAKLQKHRGKWVAIANGRIVSADRFVGQVRRDVKGNGIADAVVCWVPKDA